jgi:thiosulfate reductase cytochrome b subunit
VTIIDQQNRTPAADSFRTELTRGEDRIDRTTWAGGIAPEHAIAPRLRVGRDKWFNVLWLLPIGFVLLIALIAVAQALRTVPGVQHFIARYPGEVLPAHAAADAGIPSWVGWQHFVNLFFMAFILRSGWQILCDHPRLYWTRHSQPGVEWMRIAPPSPDDPLWTAKQDSVNLPRQVGLPGLRHSIGLARWWHLSVDLLWLVNGIVFYVMIFATPQWRRLVPTSWAVFPNALSTLIQYLSLDLPANHGWVAYNSLQLIAYFITVFVAAPLALITGLGMSPALSTRFRRFSKVFSIQLARSVHFLVMVWFVVFIVMHVTMVFATGAARNLNAMFAARDGSGALGFVIFAVAMAVVVAAWIAASPFTLRHPRVVQRVGNALVGPFQRRFEKVHVTPGQYTEADISPYFWHNGHYPDSDEYRALQAGGFADYRLRINGLVARPVELSLTELRALPYRADHPALLHPGLVGGGQVGRRLDAHDRRPGATRAEREVGGVLLHRRRTGRRHLLRCPPDRADALGADHAGLRHERRAALLRAWRPAAAAQRAAAGLQARQVAQGHRVRRTLQRGRRRFRRLQRGPRVLRLQPIHLAAARAPNRVVALSVRWLGSTL